MPGTILIADTDAQFIRELGRILQKSGHDVISCNTAKQAREQFLSVSPDVALLAYHLPDGDGLRLLQELRPSNGGAELILSSAEPNVEIAVEAMRRGAFDYVTKSAELRECAMRVERGAEVAMLRRRMAESSKASNDGRSDHALIGESPPMRALETRLQAVAGSADITVLIVGETGTGKGLVARAIHSGSDRAYEPFVAVDCTTLPANLIESELFGHERGAFSGAVASKAGRVEAAGRGTLFLDEIGELELAMQAKLLRLLEEREYTRVGGTRTRTLQARIVTATNRNLDRAVAEGRFRADLRYRLEVFVVEPPPLRDRGDDVYLLTAHFAAERARALGRPEPRLHPKVISALAKYPFPGNVRELRNMVEQAVLLSDKEELTLEEFPVLQRITRGWAPPTRERPSSLPPRNRDAVASLSTYPSELPRPSRLPSVSIRPSVPPAPSKPKPSVPPPPRPRRSTPAQGASLEAIRAAAASEEKARLIQALHKTGGNVAAAARELGLSRYQALRRLKKHGLR